MESENEAPAETEASASLPVDFTRRAYQDEMVERALAGNIICALGTGTGKTYIAVQVIQRLQHQIMEDFDRGGKRTFFVVPSVPLVEQQSKVLRKLTRLPTGAFHGGDGVDEWTLAEWTKHFRENKIIVLVHAIFRDLVAHAIIRAQQMNLVILDECHHAAKGHPYRETMEMLHRHGDGPRVLGLSASVINVKLKLKDLTPEERLKKLEDAIGELEKCTGCTVWTSLDASLKEYGARPSPQIVHFPAPGRSTALDDAENILKELSGWLSAAKNSLCSTTEGEGPLDHDKKTKESLRSINNTVTQVLNTLTALGPYCASKTSALLLKAFQDGRRQGVLGGEFIQPMEVSVSSLETFCRTLSLHFDVEKIRPGHTTGLWELITPKVQTLLHQLETSWENAPTGEGQEKEFCCIVFTRERLHAWALYHLLKVISSGQDGRYNFLRPGFCVGGLTDSGSAESSGEKASNSFAQMEDTLERFRDGRCNVLVATEVVEEGFDVRKCNLILRFDPPANYRSFVQSKGRARAKDSKFIMMIEEGKCQEFMKGDLAEFNALDETMKEHCRNRRSPTAAEREDHFNTDEQWPPFCPPGTDAVVTLGTALPLLQKYVNTLPNDNMTSCTVYMKEEKLGDGRYICTAYLPLSAAIKRPLQGPEMKTAKLAKKVVALKCCEMLYDLGELDEKNLLPQSSDRWTEDLLDFIGHHQRELLPKDDPQPGTKGRLQQYSKRVPEEFSSGVRGLPAQSYLYAVHFTLTGHLKADKDDRFEYDQSISLGLISRNPLPLFPSWSVYIRLREYNVTLVLISEMSLTEECTENVKKCHYTVFDDVIGFRRVEGLTSLENVINDTLFAVPLKMVEGQYEIDWDALRRLITPDGFRVDTPSNEERKEKGVRADHYKNGVVVTDIHGHPQRFYVMKVVEDVTPSTVPLGGGTSPAEHLLRQCGISLQVADQPMLDVRYCSKGLNFLRPKPLETSNEMKARQKKGLTEECHMRIVPELCNVFPLSAALYFKCCLLPTVLYRMHSFCNTIQLHKMLRDMTQIGTRVEVSEWKPLQNDHRFDGRYAALVDGKSASVVSLFNQEEGLGDTEVADSLREDQEKTSSSDPESDTVSGMTTVKETEISPSALFFGNIEKKKFYTDMRARIRARNEPNEPNGLNKVNVVPPAPTSARTRWARMPWGCQARLLSPPFLLDAEFKQTDSEGGKDSTKTPFPQVTSLLTAVTLAGAGDSFDLERLETMGDSFLKMTTCLYLFGKYPRYHEGRLDVMKARQISNYNLYRLAKQIHLPPFVISQVFEPLANFTPPGYTALKERAEMKLNDKSLADVMEALIGMVLVEAGCGAALKYMTKVGLKVEVSGQTVGSGGTAPTPLLRDDPGVPQELLQWTAGFDAFEEHIGYKFRQPAYLLEALTHSSFWQNRITDCYQRLEFIGDAILDFLITRYLYTLSVSLTPGQLTDLRSALVNNKTFSLLAVQHNFHNHIKFNSIKISHLIRKYVEEVAKTEDPNVLPFSSELFFRDVRDDNEEVYEGYERAEDPKTLGDIFESVAGAIFLDSGFSLDAVWRVYYNLMKERIDFCVAHCPKNPIRVLYELYPRGDVVFQKAEKLPNDKVRVAVEVKNVGTFMGIGNNVKVARCSAAKHALVQLRNATVTS